MNSKFIGVALIIIGIALAVWGFNVYDSVGSHVSRTFSGDAPIEAWAGMVGGAICIVIGLFRVK